MSVIVGLPKFRVEVGLNFVNKDGSGTVFAVDDILQSEVREQAGMLRVEASDRNISFPLYNVLWYALIPQKEEILNDGN